MTYEQEIQLQERISFFKRKMHAEFGAELNVQVRRSKDSARGDLLSKRIINAIEQVSGMTWAQITTGRRQNHIKYKRIYIGILLANSDTSLSIAAQNTQCSDHTTAIHHRKKYAQFYEIYDDFAQLVHEILDEINRNSEGSLAEVVAIKLDIYEK